MNDKSPSTPQVRTTSCGINAIIEFLNGRHFYQDSHTGKNDNTFKPSAALEIALFNHYAKKVPDTGTSVEEMMNCLSDYAKDEDNTSAELTLYLDENIWPNVLSVNQKNSPCVWHTLAPPISEQKQKQNEKYNEKYNDKLYTNEFMAIKLIYDLLLANSIHNLKNIPEDKEYLGHKCCNDYWNETNTYTSYSTFFMVGDLGNTITALKDNLTEEKYEEVMKCIDPADSKIIDWPTIKTHIGFELNELKAHWLLFELDEKDGNVGTIYNPGNTKKLRVKKNEIDSIVKMKNSLKNVAEERPYMGIAIRIKNYTNKQYVMSEVRSNN